MGFIADILMAAGSFGVAIYCYVLSGRLKRFAALESGMGGAIAVLSIQVDDMTKALERARSAANGSAGNLETMTLRGEAAAARLELLVAALHDLPEPDTAGRKPTEEAADRRLRVLRRRGTGPEMEAAE